MPYGSSPNTSRPGQQPGLGELLKLPICSSLLAKNFLMGKDNEHAPSSIPENTPS
jgi:hypothetical protein